MYLHTQGADAAQALLRYLSSAEAAAVYKQRGMGPVAVMLRKSARDSQVRRVGRDNKCADDFKAQTEVDIKPLSRLRSAQNRWGKERRMKRGVWIAVFLVIVITQGLFAADNHLNAQQQLGRRLFEQSCGVCHTRPTLISGMFGPELSRLNLGGQEDLLRKFISEGTARMPGFKYTYNPEQIAAIAAYVKTLPPGTQDLPTARTATKAPTPAQ
jgi:mono/diheme cytochrome c family protein